MTAVICSSLGMVISANAADVSDGTEDLLSYSLDKIVVTATRTEKALKDTPANVTLITAEDLKKGSYHSVFEAVKNLSQANNHTYQEDGGDYGAMISRIRMRGIDDATLVLINGNPSNAAGSATLNTIPMEQIEKIEIVKGANSVLYGPQAMGGVINIITKRAVGALKGKVSGTIFGTTGSYLRDAGVNMHTDIVNLGVKQTWGKDFYDAVFPGTTGKGTAINLLDKKSNQIYLDGRIANDLYFSYGRRYNEVFYEAGSFKNFKPNINKGTQFKSTYNNYSLTYDSKENGWKAVAGYNKIKWQGIPDVSYPTKGVSSSNSGYNTNIDIQKKIKLAAGKNSLILGGNFTKEYMNVRSKTYGGFRDNFRKSYSLYQSYDVYPSDNWEFILGLREYWVDKTRFEDSNFVLLPQIQGIYKVNDKSNYYFNVGKSFQTPSISSAFYYGGNYIINPDLKPQEGWSYEVGYKHESDKSSFSVDIFHMDVKNKFDWAKDNEGKSYRINKNKWKNTGLELNYRQQFNDEWSGNFGLTMQNPRGITQSETRQDASKYILNVGTDYRKNKFDLDMRIFSYLGREWAFYNLEHTSSKNKDHKLKNTFDLTVSASYKPTVMDTFKVTGRNLLNRKDTLNIYEYAVRPRSVTFMYERAF